MKLRIVMSDDKLDVMLHPVRMQILTALSGKRLTVQQIARLFPDIPQATLYRHVKALEKADLITIFETNQVRGTLEKVYGLSDEHPSFRDPESDITKDDHLRYFTAFAFSLMQEFNTYLAEVDNPDYGKQGVAYGKLVLNLTDNELRHLAAEITELITPLRKNKPGANRSPRVFSTILMPSNNVNEPGMDDN